MAEIVYVLCTITSLACAFLLLSAFRRTRTQLIFWSSVCFFGFALNNVILFVDKVLAPDLDLSVWRILPAVLGLGALIFGMIREDI
jgi:hypothetical protein